LKEDELNERLDKETCEYALKSFDVVIEKFKEMYDEDYKSKLYAFSNKQIVKFWNYLWELKGQPPLQIFEKEKVEEDN